MEDYDEYYQPEISTFPIYGDVVTFRAREKGSLRATPEYFQKDVHVKDDEKSKGKFKLTRAFDKNIFYMSGIDVKRGYVNEKPFKYSDSLFLKLLVDTLKKDVKMISYEKPSDVKTVYSNSRNKMLREMMLPSDNFMAEQFQMMSSLVKYGEFDTNRLREWMQQEYYKYFTDKVDLKDGSGLSVYNLVTPRSIAELLVVLQKIFRIRRSCINFSRQVVWMALSGLLTSWTGENLCMGKDRYTQFGTLSERISDYTIRAQTYFFIPE